MRELVLKAIPSPEIENNWIFFYSIDFVDQESEEKSISTKVTQPRVYPTASSDSNFSRKMSEAQITGMLLIHFKK